ncbi:MAG TPA: serine protein kinase, partial [Planctomycetaceae bacterium]|nr:serine protein kinase [Planctomycetaceae bacterium]
MSDAQTLLRRISDQQSPDRFRQQHWEGSFAEYLEIVRQNPKVERTAHQRLYDMVLSYGTYLVEEGKETLTRYRFFDDPDNDGQDAIFGLTKPLMALVNIFKSAALKYGAERRVLLLHGPVGSSKSTIVRLLKRGLERYSRTDDGALYSFGWREPDGSITWCPMHESPLRLVPEEYRSEILTYVLDGYRRTSGGHELEYPIDLEGDLCPLCRFLFRERLIATHGDWTRVVADVVVRRIFLSEQDRIGIGTFQPKDEKNQDSTELTGDINYRKIAEYGSESDPRAFNFDGEFNIANRGLIEFIEVLKLDVAFLYDLLGASQEHKIKPKKFAQTDIDTVIIGHTNEPEYRKLQSNEFMEALR